MIRDRIASCASDTHLSRRSFLGTSAAIGGGLMLSLSLPYGRSEAASTDGFAPNAFIRIDGDGQVVLTMPYVEMGQGTYTSIPMLIAEELEVSLSQVRLEHAPPNEKLYANPLLGVQATGNSNAMRGAWKPLREAGATARMMLVAAAAKRWGVDANSCRAQDGEVIHQSTGRRLKYGELVSEAAKIPVPQEVPLKSPNDFKLISEFFQLVLPPVVRHSDGTGVASPELPNFLDPKPGRTAGQIRHTNIAFGAIHKSQPRACWRRAPAARAVAVVKTPKAGW
jgi:isoquinoline 1-oxidoreductase beta subunit